MTPLERVLAAISFKEPDKIPLMQMLTLYGAREMGVPIKEYFSNPEMIVEAQLKMQKKYRSDCVNAFYYASIEIEAFGGDTLFFEDGPPNSGSPIINSLKDIENLRIPDIETSPQLQKVLKTTEMLKHEVEDKIPIIGVVISPFSLPIMQMGFDKYLDLLIGNKEMFEMLISKNQQYCIAWANAQLKAGATAIGYFDPVSSPSIISKEMYKNTGWKIARDTIAQINGSVATHYASGRTLAVIDDIADTGTQIIGISSLEDVGEAMAAANSKLAIMGNLNGIEMCRWTKTEAENAVKDIIGKTGKGGGFLLSDNHGEIPFQVPEKVLLSIADAIDKFGVNN